MCIVFVISLKKIMFIQYNAQELLEVEGYRVKGTEQIKIVVIGIVSTYLLTF